MALVIGGSTQVIEGGIARTKVTDDNTSILLESILKEMKKMNMQLMFMTDTVVDNEEVE